MTVTWTEEIGANPDAQLEPTGARPESLVVRAELPVGALQIKAFFHQPFVVKKHNATRLHYDLRLAWNGAMKSWALPEGPSLCPGEGREAIQMPDHRKEYIKFEGVIPKPRYGAGTVMLWDCGVWAPQPDCLDVDAALRNGYLGLILHGAKLKGRWALIRIDGKADAGQKPRWNLVKEADSFARNARDSSILEQEPNSVLTGRSLEEIEQDWSKHKTEDRHQLTLF